jgi:hypothetical protein
MINKFTGFSIPGRFEIAGKPVFFPTQNVVGSSTVKLENFVASGACNLVGRYVRAFRLILKILPTLPLSSPNSSSATDRLHH